MIRTRFAPSPTGHLHVGNARVALMNWLCARQTSAQASSQNPAQAAEFILRLDDTDRAEQHFADAIIEDLTWLGIDWDRTFRQSDRLDAYHRALEALRATGRLYACYESPEELALMRKTQLARGKPPVYNRAARTLSEADHARMTAEGKQPYWRFLLDDRPIAWDDMGAGAVHFDAGHVSDPVLIRADGRPLYTLSSVVDDGEFEISHIVRGADHIANTAVQIQLFEALNYPPPIFGHYPLLAGLDGRNLSKRDASLGLRDLRNEGILPMCVNAVLVALGTATAPTGNETMPTLTANFDARAYSKARPRFGIDAFYQLNPAFFRTMPYKQLRILRPDVVANADESEQSGRVTEATWWVIRENISGRRDDFEAWCHALSPDGTFAPAITPTQQDNAEAVGAVLSALAQAADALPKLINSPQDRTLKGFTADFDTASAWLKTAMATLPKNVRGKLGYGAIRWGLTGRTDGPPLGMIIAHLGKDATAARLEAAQKLLF